MATNFARVAPVLPVRSVAAALAHYRGLGFDVESYGDGGHEAVYGFARRGPVELHVARWRELEPGASTSACYLYVDDAQSLYEAWRTARVGGETRAPIDAPYGLREFVHIDPDGNLLRVGSPRSR